MKILKLAMVFFFVLLCAKSYSQSENFYPVADINKNAFTFGTYETQGYVINKYSCPQGDGKDIVVPCVHNYVIISSEVKAFEGWPLKDDELLVFVDDVAGFEESVRYKFLIQVLNTKTFKDNRINNIKLVYSEKIEVPQLQKQQ